MPPSITLGQARPRRWVPPIDWNSHEPASILHHLVFEENYEAMQFLIDRGIDMTIKDYRWDSTAQGWARYGKNDPEMAQWLEDAERERMHQLR
jgi:hypothetical protein